MADKLQPAKLARTEIQIQSLASFMRHKSFDWLPVAAFKPSFL